MKDHSESPDKRVRAPIQRIVKLYETWHDAEPDQGNDAKAAEWRAELREEGTKAPRHEGTKGKEPASQPSTQPAAEQADSRGNDPK